MSLAYDAMMFVREVHKDQVRKYTGEPYFMHLAEVILLSDFETGNRTERKAASRERLANAPGWVQTIKCADLISNTSSIVKHDPKFAVTYLEEKRLLLDVMTKANSRLLELARSQIMQEMSI